MTENLIGRLIVPKEVSGNTKYSIIVEITNLTEHVLNISSIYPELVPGEVISIEESSNSSELDELEELKRKLVRELDAQVIRAYDRIYNQHSYIDILLAPINLYSRLFSNLLSNLEGKSISIVDDSRPSWAYQALRINEWSDVEKLELEIITQLKEDSFLRKAFLIDKEKLKNCLEKISIAKNANASDLDLDTTITIQPKETVSFPFRCISPYRFSPNLYDIQFTVSYKSQNLVIQGNYPIRDNIRISTSPSAITWGGITGAILGFAVKNTLVSKFIWFDKQFWATLIGSIVLAIIISMGATKNADSKKIISIEHFAGGILIGALCAIFSDKLIMFLEKLIPQ